MEPIPCAATTGTVLVTVVGLLLLRRYMRGGKFTSNEQIPGKTVIVTGSNVGIGKETATELAHRGGRIILACRDLKKAEKAREEIVSETGNENVVIKRLDLASLASVRAFAEDVIATEPRIDILINNAGIMMCPKMLTEDGIEMQLGVNHMGHFLLTMLLLEKLKACAPSRIVNVSSLAAQFGRINFEDLNSEKSYNSITAYGQSKLANVLFTRELAKRLENTGVTVNSLHPGAVKTELGRHIPFVNTLVGKIVVFPLYWLLVKTAVEGSQTSLYCALSSELETVSGKFFSDCKEMKLAKEGRDDAAAKRLWEISEKWTQLS